MSTRVRNLPPHPKIQLFYGTFAWATCTEVSYVWIYCTLKRSTNIKWIGLNSSSNKVSVKTFPLSFNLDVTKVKTDSIISHWFLVVFGYMEKKKSFVLFSVKMIPHCFSNGEAWGGQSMTDRYKDWTENEGKRSQYPEIYVMILLLYCWVFPSSKSGCFHVLNIKMVNILAVEWHKKSMATDNRHKLRTWIKPHENCDDLMTLCHKGRRYKSKKWRN